MANKTVSGTLFKKMVTNGAVNLKNNHKEIDHLNDQFLCGYFLDLLLR